jgi:hypothetical protein
MEIREIINSELDGLLHLYDHLYKSDDPFLSKEQSEIYQKSNTRQV